MTHKKNSDIQICEQSDSWFMEVSGQLDEETYFPDIKETNKPVVVRFGNISLMNSSGIKAWCNWTARHKHVSEIRIEQAPFLFSKHCTSIRGFLGSNMKIASLYVPYYSEDTEESQDVLLKAGEHFSSGGLIQEPKVLDRQGKPMVLDVDLSPFFKFFK